MRVNFYAIFITRIILYNDEFEMIFDIFHLILGLYHLPVTWQLDLFPGFYVCGVYFFLCLHKVYLNRNNGYLSQFNFIYSNGWKRNM